MVGLRKENDNPSVTFGDSAVVTTVTRFGYKQSSGLFA